MVGPVVEQRNDDSCRPFPEHCAPDRFLFGPNVKERFDVFHPGHVRLMAGLRPALVRRPFPDEDISGIVT